MGTKSCQPWPSARCSSMATRAPKSVVLRGLFALAGVTTASIIPFAWIFMMPTNNELFRLEAASKAEPLVLEISGAKELVVKWTWLHFTRSLLPLAGAILGTLGTP